MRLKILLSLVLSALLSIAYLKPDNYDNCDELREQNARLSNEKLDLANKRDALEITYLSLRASYKDLQKERDSYKNNCSREKVMSDSINSLNRSNGEKMVILTKECNEVRDKLNCTVSEKDERIKDLEEELTDNISFKFKQVLFRGDTYNFGDKILFIPYKGEDRNDNMQLNDSLIYSLKRLINLVSKYDVGVKLKLVGECNSHSNKKKIKENSINRAENMKTHLKGNAYNLEEPFFAESIQDGELDTKAGVSIYIIRN